MWQCSRCSEAIEDAFDACWQCVGAIAGRARRRVESKTAASLQYRLSDLLFLTALFAILFSSLAMLFR